MTINDKSSKNEKKETLSKIYKETILNSIEFNNKIIKDANKLNESLNEALTYFKLFEEGDFLKLYKVDVHNNKVQSIVYRMHYIIDMTKDLMVRMAALLASIYRIDYKVFVNDMESENEE